MEETQKYMNGLLNNDRVIVASIYDSFFPKVKSFILDNKGEEEDVKDVFHDGLMYLIVKHQESPLQIRSFEAYFFTICKNIWRRTLKNKKTRVMNDNTLHYIDEDTDLGLFILEQKRLEIYQEKFHLLSPNCKEVLGSYFNGMSYEEILKELDYTSINTVRQRVFKCRAKIIQLIKEDRRYRKLNK
ncbi:sigma-70 family RNA polymerase sigma factor [Dokdonia sp.]|uniref:RNA polymerase sigma factor n=1 Tax=Dokdonia sp. TaxID=2024995 RepID=UPI0032657A71